MALVTKGVIRLRPATSLDAECILKWRNEPEAVQASQTHQPVTLDEHLVWFHRVLAQDIPVHVFIIEQDGEPIGSCRITGELVRMTIGWISIVLTSYYHGYHLSWQVLDCLMGEATRRGFSILKATVHRHNLASRKLFCGQGFVIVGWSDTDWLEYERVL